MTPRQKLLIYAALVYASANMDDVLDDFAERGGDDDRPTGHVILGGKPYKTFTSEEFTDLIHQFQPEATC